MAKLACTCRAESDFSSRCCRAMTILIISRCTCYKLYYIILYYIISFYIAGKPSFDRLKMTAMNKFTIASIIKINKNENNDDNDVTLASNNITTKLRKRTETAPPPPAAAAATAAAVTHTSSARLADHLEML